MSAEVTDADRATALQLAIDMPGVGVDGGDGWDEHVAFIAQALADQRAAADGMHGPCCDQLPSFMGGPPVFCSLRASHDGWHENGEASWSRAAADDGLRALAEWLISLDDDDPSSPGRAHRRTVNLTEIIGRARYALDLSTISGEQS